MAIFDERERTLLAGAERTISAFDYIDASARAEAAEIRRVLNEYFSHYPEVHRRALRGAICSRRNTQHNAAVFELVLHELLLRCGCAIEAIEPRIEGADGRPDFLVRTASGVRFYMEAVLPSGLSTQEAAAQTRLDEALTALDGIRSPDFFLAVFSHGRPEQPIPRGRLRSEVERWLAGLDYEAVLPAWQQGGAELPNFSQNYFGAEIKIQPVPKLRSRGVLADRAIGFEMGEVETVQPHVDIRDAIRRKGSRYGELELPYVVAVNALRGFGGEDDTFTALFGTEAVELVRKPDGTTDHRLFRQRDGVWRGPNGPQYTRISAVLSTERLTAWTVATRRMRLFLNAWAQRQLPTDALPFNRIAIDFEHERLVRECGQTPGEVLGLSADWPSRS